MLLLIITYLTNELITSIIAQILAINMTLITFINTQNETYTKKKNMREQKLKLILNLLIEFDFF